MTSINSAGHHIQLIQLCVPFVAVTKISPEKYTIPFQEIPATQSEAEEEHKSDIH